MLPWHQFLSPSTQTVKSFCRMTREKMLELSTAAMMQAVTLPSWLLTTRRNLRLPSASMTLQSKQKLQVQPWPWLLKMMLIGARWHWQTALLFWMKMTSKSVFSGLPPMQMLSSRDCQMAITPWQKPAATSLPQPMETLIELYPVQSPLRWPTEQLQR